MATNMATVTVDLTKRRNAVSLRRVLTRRSSVEWSVRIALAVAAAVLGYLAVIVAVAQVAMSSDPAFAHRLAPHDGRISALLATNLAGDGATSEDRRQADALARRALEQDPAAIAAVATLGIDADVRGDKGAARRLFAYARLLSRRDLRTQLWSIENAVERGDVGDALRHYDTTLRVFPELGDVLYPVLASAIDDPTIRSGLVTTLAAKPPWGDSFLTFLPGKAPVPQATVGLFQSARRAGIAVPTAAQSAAVDAMLAVGQIDDVWSYYVTLRPGADRRRSRDPDFSADLAAPSRLDWIAVADGGLSASVQDGAADFAAPPGAGGPLFQQVQLLPPGTYMITGHSSGIEQPAAARPYWRVTCPDGREAGRVALPNSSVDSGRFSGTIRISPGCSMQTLTFVAGASNAVGGLAGQIDRVQLSPAPGA